MAKGSRSPYQIPRRNTIMAKIRKPRNNESQTIRKGILYRYYPKDV